MNTVIAIGSDHAGFALKEALKDFLLKQNIEIVDFGCPNTDPVDYPEIAIRVASYVASAQDTMAEHRTPLLGFRRGICEQATGVNSSVNEDSERTNNEASSQVGKSCRGVLVCGTGIGMSIAANKIKGIRAALCHNVTYAELSRKHNNANILALAGRFTTIKEATQILETWLKTEFEGGRHAQRVSQIDSML